MKQYLTVLCLAFAVMCLGVQNLRKNSMITVLQNQVMQLSLTMKTLADNERTIANTQTMLAETQRKLVSKLAEHEQALNITADTDMRILKIIRAGR